MCPTEMLTGQFEEEILEQEVVEVIKTSLTQFVNFIYENITTQL